MKKVAFPREILPLVVVGVALVDFVLQSAVLLLFMLVTGYGFHAEALVLYPLSFVDARGVHDGADVLGLRR